MVRERLGQSDASAGFMLDGFPRTVAQADALNVMLREEGLALDVVLLLKVPDDLIVRRIVGRRSDPVTGEIYHLEFNPAPADVVDRLVHRKDDTEEAVRTRLGAYHSQTAPIIPIYEGLDVLLSVDGVGTPDEVTTRINNVLTSSGS
jgi:adenylate kinase